MATEITQGGSGGGLKLSHDRVLAKLKQIYRNTYRSEISSKIERALSDVVDLFAGRWPQYQSCDTRYHDLQHTMQVIILMALIMEGWNRSGQEPPISVAYFELGIIGALCHDSGYIKKRGDDEGTGAKYTFRHVQRSIDLAEAYLASLGYGRPAIAAVQNIIKCTDVQADPAKNQFSCKEEQVVGFSLGTADLLGQIAAADYIDKLPYLYDELREGYEYEGGNGIREQDIIVFQSAEQFISHYPSFYEGTVKKRLKEMGSLYEFLAPEHKNNYLDAARGNVKRAMQRATAS